MLWLCIKRSSLCRDSFNLPYQKSHTVTNYILSSFFLSPERSLDTAHTQSCLLNESMSRVWWCIPVILALGGERGRRTRSLRIGLLENFKQKKEKKKEITAIKPKPPKEWMIIKVNKDSWIFKSGMLTWEWRIIDPCLLIAKWEGLAIPPLFSKTVFLPPEGRIAKLLLIILILFEDCTGEGQTCPDSVCACRGSGLGYVIHNLLCNYVVILGTS